MVAASYGSLSVLRLLLSLPSVDVNRRLLPHLSTPLHCAASSGSSSSLDVVRLLLAAGADCSLRDCSNLLPSDVANSSPCEAPLKLALVHLLFAPNHSQSLPSPIHAAAVTIDASLGLAAKEIDAYAKESGSAGTVKEYPVDPTMPDIKTGIYACDEFRMYSFKIRTCSRSYSHDWTECPFAHPGENARRRDPRKYHYSCVPCPDYRKGGGGACWHGDMCEYAHGVFESWLHPAQYRTRMCKDGSACARRVCFFAHSAEELRPLLVSEMVPSPPFTPLSPSANSCESAAGGWLPSPSVPVLHLPGSNLQLSRLRTALNARDMLADDLLEDMDAQLTSSGGYGRVGSPCLRVGSARGKVVVSSNLDDLFSSQLEAAANGLIWRCFHQHIRLLYSTSSSSSSSRAFCRQLTPKTSSPRRRQMDFPTSFVGTELDLARQAGCPQGASMLACR